MISRKKLPIILEKEEVEKLINIPNNRYISGLRNKTIISTMINMGLRVSEVVNLKPNNANITNGTIRVINGKYGKDRDITIPNYTRELLTQWKKKRPNSKYLFTTLKGGKLSVRYLQAMVNRYTQRAGLNKKVSPHTFRHTFATEFYKQTKDIETLRKILGHADISTTQIYVTLANIDIENAMNNFKEFN